MIQDTRCKMQDTRYKIQDTRYKIQDTRYKIQDTRYRVQGTTIYDIQGMIIEIQTQNTRNFISANLPIFL